MQLTTATTPVLTDVNVGFCIPLVLLLNFSLFQYLVTTYHTRRLESRVKLLLGIAFLSFAAVVPFALDDKQLRRNLNDISEVCSVLTFLMQIVIITRDVSKRIKIKEILRLMWCAELLVVVSLGVLITNVIDLFAPVIDYELVELLDSIVEHIALVFIVGFRFYFLAIAKGWTTVLATQITELFVYSMFLFHEIPFPLLHHWTKLDWHHAQGLWMRVTIAMCLATTIKGRMASHNSVKRIETGYKSGPMSPSLNPQSTADGPPCKISSTGAPEYVPPLKKSPGTIVPALKKGVA